MSTTPMMTYDGAVEMMADTLKGMPSDQALTIAINGMRAARGRWSEDRFANANLNALLIVHALTGLMLVGMEHPDFHESDLTEGGTA